MQKDKGKGKAAVYASAPLFKTRPGDHYSKSRLQLDLEDIEASANYILGGTGDVGNASSSQSSPGAQPARDRKTSFTFLSESYAGSVGAWEDLGLDGAADDDEEGPLVATTQQRSTTTEATTKKRNVSSSGGRSKLKSKGSRSRLAGEHPATRESRRCRIERK